MKFCSSVIIVFMFFPYFVCLAKVILIPITYGNNQANHLQNSSLLFLILMKILKDVSNY